MHCALESKPALCCPGVSARIGTSKRSRMGYLQLSLLPILFLYISDTNLTACTCNHIWISIDIPCPSACSINEADTFQPAEHARLLAVTIASRMHHLLLSRCDWLPTFHGTFLLPGQMAPKSMRSSLTKLCSIS